MPDDGKQWLSSDSWLTWKHEAVIPAVGFIVRLVHELSTDEGFSSQSVTRATASSSSCGAGTSTEDRPLGSQRGASFGGCLDDDWLEVWSARALTAVIHPLLILQSLQ